MAESYDPFTHILKSCTIARNQSFDCSFANKSILEGMGYFFHLQLRPYNQTYEIDSWTLYYYSDLTLSQSFQPMATQLSLKSALPLAKSLTTASCRSSNTGLLVEDCFASSCLFNRVQLDVESIKLQWAHVAFILRMSKGMRYYALLSWWMCSMQTFDKLCVK